jgi:urease accessory protein
MPYRRRPSINALPARSASDRGAPPGWSAKLQLALEDRGGTTALVGNRHCGPLLVQKPLYPEGARTCHLVILHPPGGVAAGDELRIDVSAGVRTHALLTTPGASKWYRSEGPRALQQVRHELRDGALLEWLPRENIFFDGAIARLELEVELGARGTYFGWDIHCFGRRASGERWRRGSLQLDTRIRREGRLVFAEFAHIDAGSALTRATAGLAGFSVCGSFVIVGTGACAELLPACRALPVDEPGARTGITRLPDAWVARYLGDSAQDAHAWFTRVWALLRPVLSGKVAVLPRVWAC